MKKKTGTDKKRKSKGRKDWIGTSVAFKRVNLDYLKNHQLCKRDDVSVSWIINKLIEKFKAGELKLEIE